MAIAVLCPGCKSQFTVSDQYAGRTGPCPKCKKSITIPAVSAAAGWLPVVAILGAIMTLRLSGSPSTTFGSIGA